MKTKILVTGAKGQLGKELSKLSEQSTDKQFYFTDIQDLDITDSHKVRQYIKEITPKIIINCAAYTAVDKAEIDSVNVHNINALGVSNLALAAKINDIYMVHISTDFVFDGQKSQPYTEDDIPNPLSEYGRTKLLGEHAALESGCRTTIVRTSWLYSAGENNFLNTMIRLGRERSTLSVVFDQIGTPTAAHDLARTILLLVDRQIKEKVDMPKILHYSNEGIASWYDFAYKIMKLSNLDCKVLPIHTSEYPTPAVRPQYSVLDKTKIKALLGITIPHWEESLEKVIKSR